MELPERIRGALNRAVVRNYQNRSGPPRTQREDLVDWVHAHIESRLLFLFALNLFLLGVGWLMEIYAAIFVVVPLIVPLGNAYGINPVHLGIIFLANLELGFLTPLVVLNIFLASYRFKRPVLEVCAAALPMMAILGIGVLVITYVPWLTTGILQLLGRV